MLDIVAKGYVNETPVYLWRTGNYMYEIEKKTNPYFSVTEVFTADYDDAVLKMENVVDENTFKFLPAQLMLDIG